MITINIGTTKKNIVGHKIDKKFEDITIEDIREIVKENMGINTPVVGWCLTPKKKDMLAERERRAKQ